MKKISDKKKRLLEEAKKSPLEVGEIISVKEHLVGYTNDNERNTNVSVVKVDNKNNKLQVKSNTYPNLSIVEINTSDVEGREKYYVVGSNPFVETQYKIRSVNFSFDSILFNLNITNEKRNYKIKGIPIMELNWNPFVYDNDGKKQYYQRDFCWTLKQKQNLIESIYNDINCGQILIRKREWNELEVMANNGETELSFNDIVDGKQRLNTFNEFINNKFPDSHGDYYYDLSNYSQHRFGNNMLLGYAEIQGEVTDKDILLQFLKVNFTGVMQSEEHISFVNKLYKNL